MVASSSENVPQDGIGNRSTESAFFSKGKTEGIVDDELLGDGGTPSQEPLAPEAWRPAATANQIVARCMLDSKNKTMLCSTKLSPGLQVVQEGVIACYERRAKPQIRVHKRYLQVCRSENLSSRLISCRHPCDLPRPRGCRFQRNIAAGRRVACGWAPPATYDRQ
ncbi:hypothetical protein LZ30DRAFT_128212 [Colletotrichum cereale]|nr:hypothetical protein LZ30DRAFT_128212 [Colletotrichum cereale]